MAAVGKQKQWTTQYRKANHSIFIAQRDALKFFPKMMHKQLQELANFNSNFATKTWEQKNKLFQQISKLRTDVKRLSGLIQKLQSNPTPREMQILHTKLKSIESTMKAFKGKSREAFQNLTTEEENLTIELDLCLNRFERQCNKYPENIEQEPRRLDSKINSNFKKKLPRMSSACRGKGQHLLQNGSAKPPLVANKGSDLELDMIKRQVDQVQSQIIENGGVYCGWSSADHNDYLRIRQKYQGRLTIAFINQIKGVIPEQDEISVRQHYQTHQKYKKFFQTKKKLIQQYKFAKMQRQKGLLHQAEQDQQINRVILQPGSGFRSGSFATAFGKQNLNRSNSMSGLRSDKKQQILKWRQEKEKLRLAKQRQEQQRIQRQKQSLKKKLSTQQKKRQEVVEYRERKKLKQAEQLQIRIRQQQYDKQKLGKDQETTKKIRERQQQALKRKQIAAQQMKIKQAEYQLREELRVQAMHKKYKKIQPKLNQSTAAASSKVRYKFDGQGKDALTMAGNLLGTTSRIIPSWRKGQ